MEQNNAKEVIINGFKYKVGQRINEGSFQVLYVHPEVGEVTVDDIQFGRGSICLNSEHLDDQGRINKKGYEEIENVHEISSTFSDSQDEKE